MGSRREAGRGLFRSRKLVTLGPAAGTASPRMPSPAGPTLGSGAEGTGVRKGSRSRRSASIWVTSKAAELMMRVAPTEVNDPCVVEADTCPLLTCDDMRKNGLHDSDHRGERGWAAFGGPAGAWDAPDQ